MSQLPLDVLTIILSQIPAVRDRRETSVRTLLNCSQVNSLFYEAVSLPFMWKSHYQMRYEHSTEERERVRNEELGHNWRRMYGRRREIDCAALKLLDKFVYTRVGMQDIATTLARQSLDIWDALELECSFPLPEPFGSQTTEYCGDRPFPNDTICRRFWAGYIRDTIARGLGVSLWRRYITGSSSPALETPSFELAMSSISMMFGVSHKTITKELDALAVLCREEFLKRRVSIDHLESNYNLSQICMNICVFMREQGFTRYIQNPWGGDNSWDILNKFPHVYLTANRATIPISLVHIFVAIATRLGIDASPVNFPRVVLSYVRPIHQGADPIIVNPSARNPSNFVIHSNTPYNDNPVLQAQVDSVLTIIPTPCDAALMLIRACHNISAALPRYTTQADAHASALLVLCTNLIFQAETNVLHGLFTSADLRPLDCIFLLDELAPYLRPRCRRLLEDACQSVIAENNIVVREVSRRKPGAVCFFVGMAFVHVQYGYTGFIISWDETCKAAQAWIDHMGLNKLSRGQNQPFYEVYSVDGTIRYVAEENIKPASFTREHLQSLYRIFGQFPSIFEGADCPSNPRKGIEHRSGRGRLLLSPHKMEAFPDDSDFGAYWVENGRSRA
ncbi:hypothetical protein BDN70DRAFT_662 [Pholiota conissans]|uniref:Hemimethylated DNA-binding domain-containing protein n=1 Tax=Pholiota conissans TaxID=109636 RepID=A0A9P5ZGN2_9AGAR|nr:hypothetical protein BDN70DRAFT_662 [Pholiota conissans]